MSRAAKLRLGVLVALFAFCTVTVAHGQETVTVRVATWIDRANPAHVSAWNEVMTSWEATYPHIEIDLMMIPYGEYFSKLAVLVATGGVDVFDISDSRLAQYSASNSLLDLTPYMERDLDLDEYFMVSLDRGRYPHNGDRYYSVWTFMSPAVMYVNDDLFAMAGVDIPTDWTYDHMEVIGTKLLRDYDGDGVADEVGFGPGFGTFAGRRGYGMGSVLRAFGANDYNDDQTAYTMNTPEHRAAYEFVYSFVERGLTRLGIGSSQFQQGQVGLHFDGTWTAARLAEESRFTWTMVPPPAGPAGSHVILHGNPSMAISAHTALPEQSWAFIRHILENQSATSVYLAGNMPTRRDAANDWIAMGSELWPGFDTRAIMSSIEGSVFLPVISPEDAAAESAITNVLQQAARGEMPFSIALEEATRQANAIIGAQ